MEELAAFADELARSQTTLDEAVEALLRDNLWEMYDA